MKRIISVTFILIAIIFVRSSYADDINFIDSANLENFAKYTFIDSRVLKEHEIKKYLHNVINENYNGTKMEGDTKTIYSVENIYYVGFKQEKDTAKIYFSVTYGKELYRKEKKLDLITPTRVIQDYNLVRLDSGKWFNVDRREFVVYPK